MEFPTIFSHQFVSNFSFVLDDVGDDVLESIDQLLFAFSQRDLVGDLVEVAHRLAAFTVEASNGEVDFLQRVDADNASLKQDFWVLNNVTINKNEIDGTQTRNKKIEWETYTVPTTLTVKDIQESFASTTSMSFWKLPAYIRTLEQTGFDATRLRVHYHSLLSQPLMFCAMILLAATVSMRPPRSKGTFTMIASGVFIGFIVFFLSTFLQTLGSSQQIPVILAAWSPALIAFLLGMSAMMNIEDG